MNIQQRLTQLEQTATYKTREPNYLLIQWIGNNPDDGLTRTDDDEAGFLMVTDGKGSRTYQFNQQEFTEYEKIQDEKDIEIWLNTLPRPPRVNVW